MNTALLVGEVVVLLSGGRDSVCLLDLAVRHADAVTALHVNYGLRDGADGDEAFCRELCERLGVPLQVVHPGPPEGNVQAWARRVVGCRRPQRRLLHTPHAALRLTPGRNPLQ